MLAGLLVARGFDASAILGLGDLTDVLTSAVDEKVPDAANIPVVKHGCPELGWQDEVGAVGGESPQVHVPLKVQDLTLSTGCEWSPSAVYRDGACVTGGEEISLRFSPPLPHLPDLFPDSLD